MTVETLSNQTSFALSDQAEIILNHRYYLKDTENTVIEDAPALFRRVANAIASVDTQYEVFPKEVQKLSDKFFNMMQNLEFLPNSPTLMNAGTNQGTLSACFVLPLEDSMQDIMKAATDAAMVQKFGGGTGFALSKIRPKGARINTTHGVACGPIEVLKTLSRVSSMITQGGKRDGANMAVMSVYHPDIKEFITCKKVEGDIHNFNISVAVDDYFMEKVKTDSLYSLHDPHTNAVAGQESAREIFESIVMGAWTNGEPGMVFLDRINIDNTMINEYGPMIATNPCGEQPLLGYESCNLGSINLAKFVLPSSVSTRIMFVKNGIEDWRDSINWSRLVQVINLAVQFLDNVIDANDYSIPEIAQMTKATRKIGLGVMGFADLLVKLRIPYNSELARQVGSHLMEVIKMTAMTKSLELGAMRGVFPAWEHSKYKMHENVRNACRLTVAPTGTISMIASCASGIEPLFALAWRKQNILDGQTLFYINDQFKEDAQTYGFYSDELMSYLSEGGLLRERPEVPNWAKDIYITAPEIGPEAHVLMQATFQDQVDSGISKTINFAKEATPTDVYDSYMQAWQTGCKGITVYRNGSREKEVLVNGHKSEIALDIELCGCDNPMIVQADGCESCKVCGWSACTIS